MAVVETLKRLSLSPPVPTTSSIGPGRLSRWMPEKFRGLLTLLFNKRLWLFAPGDAADVAPHAGRS